ncbi:sensor histidine kinase [Ramlibacter sp.]|uniref:sensor histidine kinase n=1 Tax=Ramlibacter sp. TaxID=1917967 RepID=UPI003D10BF89
MTAASAPLAWASPPPGGPRGDDWAFDRLWRGFMTARVSVGIVLSLSLGGLATLGYSGNMSLWIVAMCIAYVAAALAVRVFAQPLSPGHAFDPQWVSTIGVDLLAFATLQFLQAGGLNFSALFTLPVLTAAVLGSALLALGTAAAVTLLLLTDAWIHALQQPQDYAQRFLQAGLTGIGYFAMSMLANQLSARLAREENAARRSLLAARTQAQVNELVIDTLSEGVLVIDADGQVHAANPAARALLGWEMDAPLPLPLRDDPAGQPLAVVAQRAFGDNEGQREELALAQPGGERRLVHVRTRMTLAQEAQAGSLCVMFLQDQRELEARLRTERLAAMGRMSTAVAHEIRNPLAAIAQANELLGEDLAEPTQKQLSELVRQNAQRLARIVEDILDIARVQHQRPAAETLALDESVCAICDEWAQHANAEPRVRMALHAGEGAVIFEPDHLRRVLVNLLDNALRYAGHRPGSIQVGTRSGAAFAQLSVFSDGAPIDPGVQRHLFEPFFSSESRSSGLGLYICRELCDRHGATIAYRRVSAAGDRPDGNEFFVTFRAPARVAGRAPYDTISA